MPELMHADETDDGSDKVDKKRKLNLFYSIYNSDVGDGKKLICPKAEPPSS